MSIWERLASVPTGRLTKWVVLLFWVVLIALAVPLVTKSAEVQKNDAATWLPASAESTRALAVIEGNFGAGDVMSAVIVYAREGRLTSADRTKAAADRAALAGLAAGPIGPVVVAQDNMALQFMVPLKVDSGDDPKLIADVKRLSDTAQTGAPAGLQAKVTGQAASQADFAGAFLGFEATLLYATVGLIAAILLIAYRSPVLWAVPLMTVGVAYTAASAVIYLLARDAGLVVNGMSAALLIVLVMGVGTDYALLLTARYREELRRHADRHEAMRYALGRSLPTITASAVAVAVAMLVLVVAQMNSLRGMGPVLAIGVGVALLAMVTLLPAVLVILGRWVFWPFVPRHAPASSDADEAVEHGVWSRIASRVGRRPRTIWLVSTAILGVLALGTLTLSTGLTQRDGYTTDPASVAGQDLLAAHFPAGVPTPVLVVAKAAGAQAVAAAVRNTSGVAQVLPPEQAGGWALITGVLTDRADTQAAEQTVDRVRTAVRTVFGAEALVSGQTAIDAEVKAATEGDERLVMPLILAVVLLTLILLLRSLIAPVLLLASVVISFLAAFGASALIFHALGHPTIDNQQMPLPLLGFLFLVALGVDYTIFLMTRAREETAVRGHVQGMLHSLAATGGVITSAGVVLAATFSVLAVLPVVSMLQLGILVAVGILLDTLLVRSLLVPALALDVGSRIWWPSRLTVEPQAPDYVPPAAAPPELTPQV